MPFDSFMHSGFQIGFHKLLLRVTNFSFSGIGTSLLLRSSVAFPGPGSQAIMTYLGFQSPGLPLTDPVSFYGFWFLIRFFPKDRFPFRF
jgi:hypothetical protein